MGNPPVDKSKSSADMRAMFQYLGMKDKVISRALEMRKHPIPVKYDRGTAARKLKRSNKKVGTEA